MTTWDWIFIVSIMLILVVTIFYEFAVIEQIADHVKKFISRRKNND